MTHLCRLRPRLQLSRRHQWLKRENSRISAQGQPAAPKMGLQAVRTPHSPGRRPQGSCTGSRHSLRDAPSWEAGSNLDARSGDRTPGPKGTPGAGSCPASALRPRLLQEGLVPVTPQLLFGSTVWGSPAWGEVRGTSPGGWGATHLPRILWGKGRDVRATQRRDRASP